ncbi:DUF5615 family PIN-like protein [Halobacteria archaeon AArc-curdl1]|uniref:DUF5615 family PIN-like protein n=1 Tax=Natronosalvus hydrolyticus TaxID=2979988 RepID=A0AAP2ZBM6_9EURY|nr:DUF5615 family PIN-like protein [Halobacteria archaeon AArc-curdl1]
MTERIHLLLDEHVGRIFEHLLRERGYRVDQAKDRFGERTNDRELLQWCGENDVALVSNNARDFEPLHHQLDHAGLFLYHDHTLPDTDPEGLAKTVDEVFTQYGVAGIENQVVDLSKWYAVVHGE